MIKTFLKFFLLYKLLSIYNVFAEQSQPNIINLASEPVSNVSVTGQVVNNNLDSCINSFAIFKNNHKSIVNPNPIISFDANDFTINDSLCTANVSITVRSGKINNVVNVKLSWSSNAPFSLIDAHDITNDQYQSSIAKCKNDYKSYQKTLESINKYKYSGGAGVFLISKIEDIDLDEKGMCKVVVGENTLTGLSTKIVTWVPNSPPHFVTNRK